MSPSEGVVAVGGSENIVCSVKPVDASVFVSQAVLRVGDGVNAIKPAPLLEIKVGLHGDDLFNICTRMCCEFESMVCPEPTAMPRSPRRSSKAFNSSCRQEHATGCVKNSQIERNFKSLLVSVNYSVFERSHRRDLELISYKCCNSLYVLHV